MGQVKGRVLDTAVYTIRKLGLAVKTLDWLMEFPAKVDVILSEEIVKAYPDTRKSTEGGKYLPRIV